MKQLHVISGGAAQGLVGQLSERFAADHGFKPEGTFGAVGLMKDKLLAGAPCDVVILTSALIQELEQQGHVKPGTARPDAYANGMREEIGASAARPSPKSTRSTNCGRCTA